MDLSNNLLNGILESSKESIILALDYNYCYLAFNENHRKTMKNIWGVNIQVGDNMLDCIKYREDQNKAKANFDRALNGESFTVVEQYGYESINRRWYQNEYNPLYDDKGDIVGLTVFLTDVTEREKSEENRNLSNKLIEDSPLGIFQANSKGEYIDVNSTGCRILGYSREEFLNMYITDILDENYVDEGEKHFEELSETGYAHSVLLMKYKSGEKLWIDLSASKITEDRYIGYFKDITEEIRTKEKLVESEHKFRSFVENANDIIYTTNMEGFITYISPNVESILGYKPNEMVGTYMADYIHPDDLEKFKGSLMLNKFDRLEGKVKVKNGNWRWFSTSGSVIQNSNNEEEFLCISRDITERKKSEETAKEKIEELENFFNITPSLMCIVGLDGNFVKVNKYWVGLTGYSVEKLEVKNFLDFVHPDDIESTKQVMGELGKENSEVEGFVNRYKDINGDYRYIEWYAKVNNGLIYASSRDITEYKQVEEELSRSEEFRKQVFESSRIPIIVMDASTFRYIDCNNAAVVAYGYSSKEQVLDLTPLDVSASRQHDGSPSEEKAILYIQQAISEGSIVFEWKHQRPDGCIWDAEVHLLRFFIGNREFLQFSLVDITERKQAEQKIHDYAMELEHKNQEINNLYKQLSKEISKAEKVHERLLPSNIESIQDISITSYYQPAENIGGDFYNVIRKGDKLVFFISDVTGHGLEGAIVSAFIKESIDSYLDLNPNNKIKPDDIVRHVCRQFRSENYPDDYFISIFLGVLDLQTYDLEYIGMGFQESLLVSFENGDKLELNVKGLPITKAIPEHNLTFNVKKIELDPKTTLMINSDGLTEQANEEGEIFKEKLQEIFFANSHFPVEVLKSIINEEFRSFNNGDLQGFDDITYLLIKLDEDERDLCEIFDSRLEEINTLDTRIYECFKKHSVDEIYFQGTKELVMNAIEHGNKLDENKKVYVSFKGLKDKLIITVEDEGDGFDWRDLLDNKCLDLEGEEERGRGIAMTRIMCDRLFYNEKGNKAFLILEK